MSDWGGNWGDPTGSEPQPQPEYADSHGKPAKNPMGGHLRPEQVQLKRRSPIFDPADGVISDAFEGIKEHPFETLLLALIAFLIQNCASFCNAPFNLMQGFEQGMNGGSDSEYDYGGSILAVAGDFLSSIGAVEIGVVFGILGLVLVGTCVYMMLYAAIYGAQYIIWFRIYRRQDVSLSHVSDLFPFFVKLIFTYVIYGTIIALPIMVIGVLAVALVAIVASTSGSEMLTLAVYVGVIPVVIIAIVYLTARLFFVNYIVIDKNLAYFDAIKASWQMTEEHVVDIVVLLLLLGLINIGGFFLCLVGMIFTTALSQGAMLGLYNRIAEPGNAYISGEDMADVFS